ncbi:MFS transporter [Kitasatospora sp. MAP5-34]|uniref:MFS transporter n=1 Tax=Kitasatospora sp. MAP5-34 TaxID=3035102 RepID=UPI0024763895|nr:MFS transporter [Kitasatospora sp. MAP5-34]MDH6578826.1 MFS family permease [Kitasatospora sp. MAP5-34]
MSGAVTSALRTRAAGWASEVLPARGPGRTLYWASLVNAVGTGMYLVSSAIYFVRCLGLSETKVGLGLTVGSLIGLVSGVPAGHLADRFGARRVYVVSLLGEALTMCLFTLAGSFWTFVAATTGAAVAASASSAARGPIIQFVSEQNAAQLKSHLRSVSNAGFFVGGAAAGVVLGTDRQVYYLLLILGNAASFALCAALMYGIPKIPATLSKSSGKSWTSLRDLHYLRIVAINSVLSLQYPVLPIVLPLWVVTHTDVPRWTVATMIPLNTVLVVLLQMRAARRVTGLRSGGRLLTHGGVVMSASFVLMATVPMVASRLQIAVLLLAVVINALGEIFWVTGSYELSFGLAPAESLGQYLGLHSMGGGLGRAVSSALVSYLCLSLGFTGWLAFSGLILLAALSAPFAVNRAISARAETLPKVLA